MNLCDLSPTYVRAIAPYQPGKPISELAREMGIPEHQIVKLASNENPLGPSPRALEAAVRMAKEIHRYPDGAGFELKAALSRKLGVGMEQIVLGNGSNDVLDMVARAFLAPGTSSVYSQHAFAVYPIATLTVGATGIVVPAVNFGHDLDATLQAIRPDTKVVWIANPNNPTGTLNRPAEVLAFLEKAPASVIVVLDEAYNEYLPRNLQSDSVGWLGRFPNLIVSRTFSKAYGLAGLRVGYGLACQEVADMLNRVRHPFNVNLVAQSAAVAALEDEDYLARGLALNDAGMKQVTAGLEKQGRDFIPSHGNFLCFHAGDAARVNQGLLRRGVIVRPVANYGMPEYLRVSIGTEHENQRFLTALTEVMSSTP
jgi:histidinol-phosphate aminotransferase